MKILLMRAPQVGFYHEMQRHMPIGMAYLATACRGYNHEVTIFDSLAYPDDNYYIAYHNLTPEQQKKVDTHPAWSHHIHWGADEKRIEEFLIRTAPDVVGLSIMHSPMYDLAYEFANKIKHIFPNITVIAGGMHATIAYNDILQKTAVDYVLLGEGERTLPKLLDYLDNGGNLSTIDGIAYRDYNQIVMRPVVTWNSDLDHLSYPSVDLLDMGSYNNTATLITSRGCPFSCKYCTVHPVVGRRFRARSPQNVLDEIIWYIEHHGIRSFNIEDDNFTFDIERAKTILKLIIDLPYKIDLRLPNGITAIGIDEDFINLMVLAGVSFTFIGLESTSNSMLAKIGKEFTSFSKVENILKMARERGRYFTASLILGLPEQTIDDIVNDIVTLAHSTLAFSVTPCYPILGSELWKNCIDRGLISPDMDYTWFCEYNFPLETNNFTRRDIYELWIACLAINYLNGIWDWAEQFSRSIGSLLKILHVKGDLSCFHKIDHGYTLTMHTGKSFSERMRIAKEETTLNDKMDADFIKILLYLYTGTVYVVVQTDNVFSPQKRACFSVYKDMKKVSVTLVKLSKNLFCQRH